MGVYSQEQVKVQVTISQVFIHKDESGKNGVFMVEHEDWVRCAASDK